MYFFYGCKEPDETILYILGMNFAINIATDTCSNSFLYLFHHYIEKKKQIMMSLRTLKANNIELNILCTKQMFTI